MSTYWRESLQNALEECGLVVTEEQLNYLTNAIVGSHEIYGFYHGHECIHSGTDADRELAKMKREKREQEEWEAKSEPCTHCLSIGLAKDGWGREWPCSWCDGKGRVRKTF